MRPPSVSVALEGLPIIGLSALASLCFALLGWGWPVGLGLVFTAFSLHFFRDPDRVTPEDPDLAVAPADGKVIEIAPALDPISGEKRLRICVFMNVFNVHVNRAPVAGRVTAIKYFPGKFFNASLDKASTDNERCALSIEDAQGRSFTVVQIAGLIARRIVCRVERDNQLERGERFGLIKFGSRVDLYLPEGYVPLLQTGDKTTAGQTPMAAFRAVAS